MYETIFSPPWFYGIDSLFEVVGIIVTLLIGSYCLRLYSFSKKDTHRNFAVAFFIICASYVLKVLTNYVVYNSVIHQLLMSHAYGDAIAVIKAVRFSQVLFIGGFLLHRFLFLLGLLIMFYVLNHYRNRPNFALHLYFIALATIASYYSYLAYYLTAALFLLLIFSVYFTNYKEKSNTITMLVALSFFTLFLSQLCYIFVIFDLRAYVVGEFLQLAGFIVLLCSYYLLVLKK